MTPSPAQVAPINDGVAPATPAIDAFLKRQRPTLAALEFVDLAAIAEGNVELPKALVPNLVVTGQINWFTGHPGNGKTTLAMYVAREAMERGVHVVYLDWENGAAPTARRLMAVGVAPELMRERFHYVAFPSIPAAAEGFDLIAHAVAPFDDVLVIFDSASKALSHAGLDENSNPDATRWTTEIVMPTREAGATVMVLDHPAKGATRTNPYARGAGAKLADTDVQWFVEADEKFSRENPGVLRLTRQKDRDGVLPVETVWYAVGDGRGGLPITEIEGPTSSVRNELRGRILEVLRTHSAGLSQNQIEQLAGGNRQRLREELQALTRDPASGVRVEPSGRALRYWHESPAAPGLEI